MVFATLAKALEEAGKPITGENLLAQRRASPIFTLVGGRMEFLANGTVAMPVQINEVVGDGSVRKVK